MQPSSSVFPQEGVKTDKAKDGAQQIDMANARAAASASLLEGASLLNHGGAATAAATGRPGNGTDAALLESIILAHQQQEQQRRALFLAASAPFPGAGGPLSSFANSAATNPTTAFLSAEGHRALLLGGNSSLELSPMDRLLLASSQGGMLGGAGGMGGIHSLLGGSMSHGNAAISALLGQQLLSQGRPGAFNMFSTPSALLLSRQRGQEQAALSSSSAQQYSNDQLLLDAMEQGGRKGRTGTFPQKLHRMLADLEKEEGGAVIASYLPHGHAFVIHDQDEFVKTTMPKYFRMSRFSSFQRQLNLYEFNRISADGPDKRAYFHDLFHRGRPVLACQIRRNKIKGEGSPSIAARDKLPLFAGGQGGDAVSSLLGTRGMSAGVTAALPRARVAVNNSVEASGGLARLLAAAGAQNGQSTKKKED
jgi:hypothetical protein